MGKGLLVTGGEESYALGGYKNTPLEAALPVDMNVKSDEEHPNLGLCWYLINHQVWLLETMEYQI